MDDIFLLGILRGCPKELQNTLLVLVSLPPTVLNENLIRWYKLLFVESPKKAEVGSFEKEEHQTDFSIKSTKTGVQTKIKRKSQHSATGEAKSHEKELSQSRDIHSFFVFKGTKTS